MEPTKKQKVKYFIGSITPSKVENKINEFLSQNPSINVKSITMDNHNVMLLYEE